MSHDYLLLLYFCIFVECTIFFVQSIFIGLVMSKWVNNSIIVIYRSFHAFSYWKLICRNGSRLDW